MTEDLRLVVNGREQRFATPPASLTDLIASLGLDPGLVVAEVNGDIVSRADFAGYAPKDGDRVELVRFVGGG